MANQITFLTARNYPDHLQATGAFKKRIGNTTYRVNIHFNTANSETARDKILRIVKTEAAAEKEVRT